MKSASAGLINFLNSAPSTVIMAELYTFTLTAGTVLRYTDYAVNITYNGNVFSAVGPFMSRTRIRSNIGLENVSATLTVVADPTHQINTVPFLQALARGDFDGADVLIEQLFMPTFGDTSLGTIVRFKGSVGEISEITEIRGVLTVNSRLNLLNAPLPRNLFSPGCRHTLFDDGCALNRVGFEETGTVAGSSTRGSVATNLVAPGQTAPPVSAPTLSVTMAEGCNLDERTYFVVATYTTANGETVASLEAYRLIPKERVVVVQSPAPAAGATGWNVYIGNTTSDWYKQNGVEIPIGTDWTKAATGPVQGTRPPRSGTSGYYQEGTVTFLTGANTGVVRKVQYQSGNVITVVPLLPAAPQIGDQFRITPGCDKQLPTCRLKFNNATHFGGFPFIPSPEQGI